MMMTIVIGIEKAMMMVMMLTTMSIARGPPSPPPTPTQRKQYMSAVSLGKRYIGDGNNGKPSNCLQHKHLLNFSTLSVCGSCQLQCFACVEKLPARLSSKENKHHQHQQQETEALTCWQGAWPLLLLRPPLPPPLCQPAGSSVRVLLDCWKASGRPRTPPGATRPPPSTATTASKDTPLPPLQTLRLGACMCDRFCLYLCLCVTTYTQYFAS